MNARLLSILTLSMMTTAASSSVVEAQYACTGPKGLPTAGSSAPLCYNGRMGFAATEYAMISTAANIPHQRAIDFAKRSAEIKAKAALAEALSKSELWSATIQSDSMLESSERSAWMSLISDTRVQTMRTQLSEGVRVIGVEAKDGNVYVTVATTPDMKDLADSLNNYQPNSSSGNQPAGSNQAAPGAVDPYSVAPKNVAPDFR